MGTDTSKSLFDEALKEIMAGHYVRAELLLQQASEINEENTTLYAASWATLLALRGRESEAVEILEERLATFSTDANLLLAYGLTLEKMKKYEDAEDAFRESLAADPDNPGALRGLSQCLERKGDIVGGCRLAAKAFSLAPDNLVLAKTAAELLERAGQKNTAFEVLELGAHYNPEDEYLVTSAVKKCLSRGESDRAWDLLSQVDVTQPWAAGWKASFLDWSGDEEKANQLIQDTLRRPAGADNNFLFQLCNILLRRGQVAVAENYLEHILESEPQHQGALLMKADFSIGRFDYNPAVDPLGSAIAASTELPGWARFWHLLRNDELEKAEETLAAMADDEELTSSPMEVARLELAEQFFLVMSTGENAEREFHALEELPTEAACGVILEYLEILESKFAEVEELADFRELLNETLGDRDPVLRLTRLYALARWDELAEVLENFRIDDPLAVDPGNQGADRATVARLYRFLHALGTEDEEEVERFDFKADPVFTGMVFDVLFQRPNKNRTEQRFLDKMQGALNEVKVSELPEDEPDETYFAGDNLTSQDREIVLYETEDGELVEGFDEEEFEVLEEVEIDPEDEDYEYVWVEEEIEEELETEEPQDSY